MFKVILKRTIKRNMADAGQRQLRLDVWLQLQFFIEHSYITFQVSTNFL